MKTFTRKFNMRLSPEMDSMMSMMGNQINRAISTAIAESVFPEIQNIVSSMSSSGNIDTEASSSPNSQENTEENSGFKSKVTKKDSRSACDLRAIRDSSPYTHRHVFFADAVDGHQVREHLYFGPKRHPFKYSLKTCVGFCERIISLFES